MAHHQCVRIRLHAPSGEILNGDGQGEVRHRQGEVAGEIRANRPRLCRIPMVKVSITETPTRIEAEGRMARNKFMI